MFEVHTFVFLELCPIFSILLTNYEKKLTSIFDQLNIKVENLNAKPEIQILNVK